jgi:hypothetical protein
MYMSKTIQFSAAALFSISGLHPSDNGDNAQLFTTGHGTARDTFVVCYARRKQLASLIASSAIFLSHLALLLRRFHHIYTNIICSHHLDIDLGYRKDAVVD